MYDETTMDQKVVIVVEHGFSVNKTKGHIFSNRVTKLNDKPRVIENSLYFEGNHYAVGGKRMSVKKDKTSEEDYFILTLAAVAKELNSIGVTGTVFRALYKTKEPHLDL